MHPRPTDVGRRLRLLPEPVDKKMQKSPGSLELWMRMNRPVVRLSCQDAMAAIVRTHKRVGQRFHPKTGSEPPNPPSQSTTNHTATCSKEKDLENPGPV